MDNTKILLMYITKSSGHHRATLAIESALKEIAPQSEILNINGLAHAYPILEKIVNTAYMSVIKRRPQTWEYLYDNPDIVKKTGRLRRIFYRVKQPKMARLFRRFRPQAVICSQAFPCTLVGDYKKRYKDDVPLIGVLTDFAPHHYWLHDQVDYYIVLTEEARDRLIRDGIAKERIKLYGIPIDPKFTKPIDKEKVANKLGLSLDIPILLIMGGGQGLGPMKAIIQALSTMEEKFQVVALTGINKCVYKAIKKIKFPYGQKACILPFVENVHELMDIASLIITKPGGMTTSEALAKGLPMVIVNPIPGQEARNTQLLLKKGIAIEIDDLESVATGICELLQSPGKLKAMSRAAQKYSKPQAALDIARLVLKK